MNPKDYLKQYRESLDRLWALEEHMYDLRAKSESLQTPHGRRINLDAAVANLVDTEQEIACQTERMKQLQQEVSRMILKVADPDQRVLLTLVYIEGKSLVDAADIMTYSYRQAKRIHRHALHDVANILAEDAQACN